MDSNSLVAVLIVVAVIVGMALHRQRQIRQDQLSSPEQGTGGQQPSPARTPPAAAPAPEATTVVPVHGQVRLRLATSGGVQEWVLDQTPYTIGRNSRNRLIFDTDIVSRWHAKMVYHPGEERWHIEDVGSTNGLFVNGRRVGREVLRNGDAISLGDLAAFTFVSERVSRETPMTRLVQGRYTNIVRLSPGGNADVYRAVDSHTGQTVAVKVPRLGNRDDINALRMFQEEMRVGPQLRHTHVIRVLGGDRLPDGTPCMIMEFLSGGSLRQRMTPGKPLPEETVRAVGRQIGEALAYLHSCDIVHRDIKPENVLFTGEGILRVTDFGIAYNRNDARAVAGLQIGTPHYMCPEQIRCEEPTPKFDLYALGCVLYEMSVGSCPFEGSYEEVIECHRSRPPQPPSQNPHSFPVSPDLDRLIMKLLNKNPYQRPASAMEVVSMLSGRVPA